MKIVSPKLDLLVLRTICANKRPGCFLAASIDESYIGTPAAREAYTRISSLMASKAEVMTWEQVINDPVLSEDTRSVLGAHPIKPILTMDRATRVLEVEAKYRKARLLYGISKHIVKAVQGDHIDVDNLVEQVGDRIAEAQLKVSTESVFSHTGKHNNSSSLVKKVLSGSATTYIPTGIKAYDSRNLGFAKGNFVMFGATTSSGKSAIASQIGQNMAKWGAKVAKVSLEMSQEEEMQRTLAYQSLVDLNKIINPTTMTMEEKKKVQRAYTKYAKDLKKKDAVYTVVVPDEDLTVQQTMFLLKPYHYDVIIIDYIGLLAGTDGDDQWRDMANVARYLKRFATMNDVLIIALAQLNDDGYLKFSKAMKDHANVMWSWNYTSNDRLSHIITINNEKSRNQKTFSFQVKEDFAHVRVVDLSEEEQSGYDTAAESRQGKARNRRNQPRKKGLSDDY